MVSVNSKNNSIVRSSISNTDSKAKGLAAEVKPTAVKTTQTAQSTQLSSDQIFTYMEQSSIALKYNNNIRLSDCEQFCKKTIDAEYYMGLLRPAFAIDAFDDCTVHTVQSNASGPDGSYESTGQIWVRPDGTIAKKTETRTYSDGRICELVTYYNNKGKIIYSESTTSKDGKKVEFKQEQYSSDGTSKTEAIMTFDENGKRKSYKQLNYTITTVEANGRTSTTIKKNGGSIKVFNPDGNGVYATIDIVCPQPGQVSQYNITIGDQNLILKCIGNNMWMVLNADTNTPAGIRPSELPAEILQQIKDAGYPSFI